MIVREHTVESQAFTLVQELGYREAIRKCNDNVCENRNAVTEELLKENTDIEKINGYEENVKYWFQVVLEIRNNYSEEKNDLDSNIHN